jgi:ABC-type hemin transport system substrate-binding protein
MAIFKVKKNHDALRISSWFFIFMVLISSCDKNPLFSSTESISKILESPSKYHDKVVSVKGKVTESIVAFGVGYFVLSDRTSSIVIIPSKTFPKVGEEVYIKGSVKNAFVIGDKSLTVIMGTE